MPISRRQSWRPWQIKDPASETTAIANERARLIVSRAASNAVLRRNLVTIQANSLRWRRFPVRDIPVAQPDSALQTRYERQIGVQQALDAVRSRNNATIQANVLMRRRPWRKDPASETTTQANLRIVRPTGNQLASQRALWQRAATTTEANYMLRLMRRELRSAPVTSATRNERIQAQVGLLAAQQAKRMTVASAQSTLRLWRVLAWVAPSDGAFYTAGYTFTERERGTGFIEIARGTLTELERNIIFTEQFYGDQ